MGTVVEFPLQPIDLERVRLEGETCEVLPFPARPGRDSFGLADAFQRMVLEFSMWTAVAALALAAPWPDSRETSGANAARETPDATDCN